jgi:hypothetical protein
MRPGRKIGGTEGAMIFGGIAGLLVAVAYTLVTGKLQLTKNRIIYGPVARVVAVASLLPLVAVVGYVLATGRTVTQPGGLGLFLGALIACVILNYALGWRFGEPPRG